MGRPAPLFCFFLKSVYFVFCFSYKLRKRNFLATVTVKKRKDVLKYRFLYYFTKKKLQAKRSRPRRIRWTQPLLLLGRLREEALAGHHHTGDSAFNFLKGDGICESSVI